MGVWTSQRAPEDMTVMPRFTRAGMVEVPRDRVPDGPMLPQTAYQIVLDEVMLAVCAGETSPTIVGISYCLSVSACRPWALPEPALFESRDFPVIERSRLRSPLGR